ncbi:MAG: IS200/IS605 family transposase [Flavobacteriales bacterium]|nr:IS200/IS605 family transposase [Flavobacteriales bacterium]MBK6894056.1 IS200/IS605 family transposase [Flavobacteriales bacterium]MBK7248000.1 IS200/IS605 family transposase [Flavobacteriales bacterium]MBK9060919.1 IS200/IS605 family transposase [Flavobacteriales bacterium]MBK9598357.1 IS200/IS605 family transposase [Flavobacteriales bacterium]
MMSTYFKLHYHIVFATKRRVACLDKAWRAQLWEYMGGTIRGLGGVPHGVGGYNDHVHLLIDLKPTQLLPDVVRELKKASTEWVRAHHGLRSFQWQEGYGVFSVGWRERDSIKDYIARQEEHHGKRDFHEEYAELLKDAGVTFDPKYFP